MMKYDGLIMTLNEADTIKDCIDSLYLVCEQVYVLDSFSDDNTVAVAEAAGASVLQREFDDYASQRNYALTNFDFKNEVILFFDADERLSNELTAELQELSLNDKTDVIFIRRFDIMFGKKLMHATGYPTWAARGFRRGKVTFTREINEGVEFDGEMLFLKEHFMHYPLIKGFDWWVERHRKYAKMEAEQLLTKKYRIRFSDFKNIDKNSVRHIIKKLVYNLPLRPYLIFLIFYIVRRGFLDGRAGLKYAQMRFYYEVLINLYVKIGK